MNKFETLTDVLKDIYSQPEIRAIISHLSQAEKVPLDYQKRLLNHEPVQYITGETWFYRRKFAVNRNTLIPRPETEELCHLILNENENSRLKFIDIGTGSGCIPVTLLAERNMWNAIATDISAEAIEIAALNAKNHHCKERLELRMEDFLNADFANEQFDIIVSNPPYIAETEKSDLNRNVVEFEPHNALFAIGKDPLIFYRRLNEFYHTQSEKCVLYAEINAALPAETAEIFGQWTPSLIKDWSGNIRFIKVQK